MPKQAPKKRKIIVPPGEFIKKSPRFAKLSATQTHWWRGLVGYQVYVLSFADSNGDGIGDLNGITEKLEYIKWLGVDIVWVNPFFESPGYDHGYDVSDYLSINPKHGTMQDFERLVEQTHALEMAFVLDIVPNHTSSQHRWFQESKSSLDNPKRDWYIWKDPGPDGGPPNNWVAHFGGPAWTFDPGTGQYYCHLFLPEQPDLNWRNPQVQAAFDEILEFWCDKGVDGFRVDVAHAMIKHPDFPDNPKIAEPTEQMGARAVFNCFEHKYDLDQDEIPDVFRNWRKTVAPYDAMLLAEIHITQGNRFTRFTGDEVMDLAFHLPPMWSDWNPAKLISEIVDLCEHAPGRVSWVLSNHDGGRPVSRFGGGDLGLRRAFAVTTAMFALRGVPFIFQGEELGLPNAVIGKRDLADPLATRNKHGEGDSRDVCRAHMPWEAGVTNGFTTAKTPWLKSQPRPFELTVAGQRWGGRGRSGVQSGGNGRRSVGQPPKSGEESVLAPLAAYRSLIQLRKDYPEVWHAPLNVESPQPEVLLADRGNLKLVANLSAEPFETDLGLPAKVLFSSSSVSGRKEGQLERDGSVVVPPETSVIFEFAAQ